MCLQFDRLIASAAHFQLQSVIVVTITTLFDAPKNCPAVVSRGGCVHCEAATSRGELSPLDKSAAPYCRHVRLVKAVRGILMRECANLYKSMKIGTLVIFDMLCPNLPGAKANSQWCRHIRQFKMAAA